MTDFRLRTATSADLDAIKALVAEGLAEFGYQPDPASSEADLENLEAAYHGGVFLVAVASDDTVLASGGLLLLGDGEAKIRKMYVRRDARGRGLGQTILRRLLDEARTRRIERVRLETTDAMTGAQRLYERNGFRRVEGVPASPRCDRVYVLTLTRDEAS
jgi:ribosomal protein S18 acetylase RimI-like enzyme